MIEIALSRAERSVVFHALLESYGGYAGGFLTEYLKVDRDRIKQLDLSFHDRSGDDKNISLPLEDWRLIIDAIGAVVHELGPEELQTITGHELPDFLNTARLIYAQAYQRICTERW